MIDSTTVHSANYHQPDGDMTYMRTLCEERVIYFRVSWDTKFRDVTCPLCLHRAEKELRDRIEDVTRALAALQVAS